MGGYIIIAVVFMLISLLVSNRLKSKFKKYSKVTLQKNLSGKEVAEMMLADHGIHDVKVVMVRGSLTDHYNPATKTVNLSEQVYIQRSTASAAVASHECGHAVQHAEAYRWLTMRSNLVPVVNISSNFMHWIILAGLGVFGFGYSPILLLVGIALYGLTTLFSFITLPVEFDASKRALEWVSNKNIVTREEYEGAQDALKWAAMTYVVAALGSLATLLYYVMIFLGND
jgi:Zn-dependent membrane protease YugP